MAAEQGREQLRWDDPVADPNTANELAVGHIETARWPSQRGSRSVRTKKKTGPPGVSGPVEGGVSRKEGLLAVRDSPNRGFQNILLEVHKTIWRLADRLG